MKKRIPLIAMALALVMLMSTCAMPSIVNLQEGNNYNADMENASKATESNGRVWPWEDPSITLPEFTGAVAEPGTITSLKILVMGDKSAKAAWEFFPQIAKEAGIDIKISILCMNVNKSQQASIQNHRWQSYNYTHYQNNDFDKLYVEAKAVTNDSVRMEMYKKMNHLIMDEAPVVVLYYDQILHFTHKNISGLQSNAMNSLNLKRVVKTKK